MWVCMSLPNIVHSLDIGILYSTVFPLPFSIYLETQQKKKHNRHFDFSLTSPKGKEWMFTLRFQHHHKMFCSVIKILIIFIIKRLYVKNVSVCKNWLAIREGIWRPLKTHCDQNMRLQCAWIQLRLLLLPDPICFTKVWISHFLEVSDNCNKCKFY